MISAYLTDCAVPGTEKYKTIMYSVTEGKVSRIIGRHPVFRRKARRGQQPHIVSAFPEYMHAKPDIAVLRAE